MTGRLNSAKDIRQWFGMEWMWKLKELMKTWVRVVEELRKMRLRIDEYVMKS